MAATSAQIPIGVSEKRPQQNQVRVRRDIFLIYKDYAIGIANGDPKLIKPLEDLITAFKGISELSPDDPNSFFKIGGYHGMPFRGAGWGNPDWWGGYCHHGNVLFPTWHRAYCLRLEDALRSIPGCQDVTLPFWNETSHETELNGIPEILTQPKFTYQNGTTINNPLYSFTFPRTIFDNLSVHQDYNYTKQGGYQTVRYPLSGLVGTTQDQETTKDHNAKFPDPDKNTDYLNQNVKDWLGAYIVIDGKKVLTGTRDKFQKCLRAPNYTVFSNTTSAKEWNQNNPPQMNVTPLESPHNDIHLAVGGFEAPGNSRDPISGANGDMGENDTAGLDPIFFFHHCFIDKCFWEWQRLSENTRTLEIIPEYPGTNSVDSQGPTPGIAGGTWLSMETPLTPFKKNADQYYTSNDVVNTEKQLGYTYQVADAFQALPPTIAETTVKVSGIDKASISGSFFIGVYAEIDGKEQLVGTESVLSRWHVTGCKNCQLHADVQRYIPLPMFTANETRKESFNLTVKVHTREAQTEEVTPNFRVIRGPVAEILT